MESLRQADSCNRALYADAETEVAMLPPDAARCVGAAIAMYQRILQDEDADYDVFTRRVRVPGPRKTALVTTRLARSALLDIDLYESVTSPCHSNWSRRGVMMIPRIEEVAPKPATRSRRLARHRRQRRHRPSSK